jgi:hypothetical protein
VEVGTPGINPVATTRVNATTMPGKLQNEIARKLNVSVMTLHRWRKAPLGARPVHKAGQPTRRAAGTKLLNSSSKIHCCGDW